jgi:predicted phage tail protein
MLKKVTLYGELAEKYGKDWSLDVNSPVEAFKALSANNQGFRQFVAYSEERGVGYKVIVGKSYINDYSELGDPSGRQEIKIIPVILGAKSKGLGMILMGALIIGGFYMYGQSIIAAGEAMGAVTNLGVIDTIGVGVANAGSLGGMAMRFAGSLILGGIAAMLAPTPETPDTADKPTNYGFDGAANTARQGYAIPVCYGQLLIGGTVISSGVSPEDYTP